MIKIQFQINPLLKRLALLRHTFDDARSLAAMAVTLEGTNASAPDGTRLIEGPEYSLEGAIREQFANEGVSEYSPEWPEVISKEYQSYKDQRGGGQKKGVFENSKTPLKRTFIKGEPQNYFRFNKDSKTASATLGSARSYAKSYHEGGRYWRDQGPDVARPIGVHPAETSRYLNVMVNVYRRIYLGAMRKRI